MSPFEHGEVFVLDDGGEVRMDHVAIPCCCNLDGTKGGSKMMRCAVTQADLDLGNYERFLDITLAKDNNITTGKIYQASTQTGWSGCWHECRCTLDASEELHCRQCSR